MTVLFSTIPGEHRWHVESGWYNNNNIQPGSGDVDGGNGNVCRGKICYREPLYIHGL
jgi:hypothetical protein